MQSTTAAQLDRVAALLQQSEWAFPDGRGEELAAALRDCLCDSNWSVTQRCLLIISDLVAELHPEVRASTPRSG